MKVYISGPITGYEEGNRPAFDLAKKALAAQGYEVITPMEDETPEQTAAQAAEGYGQIYWNLIAKDVLALSKAEGIVFLWKWEQSRGARLEAYIGLLHGKPMWQIEGILDTGEVQLAELTHPYVAGVCAAQWADKEMLKRIGLAA